VRSVQVTQFGDVEVLELHESEPPSPGPGEVVVEVAAAGVNFIDIYQRSGVYPLEPPFTAGSEGAGRVVEVGESVTGVGVGDTVAWLMVPGAGYAERVVVPADRCVPVPDDLDPATAAAVMLQGITVDYLTRSTYRVEPGDHVLVHAAAGGVGLLLTSVATALGARVIGTASTDDKCAAATRAGAWRTINYSHEDVAARVRDLTDGAGVRVAYDGVGASTREASLDSLGRRGSYVLFGQASGAPAAVSGKDLSSRGSLFFTRPTVVDYIVDRDELIDRATRVFGWVRDGVVEVTIGGTYSLDEAPQAQSDLEHRRTTGKLLIRP
jgi:NADPH2:quinone reductase